MAKPKRHEIILTVLDDGLEKPYTKRELRDKLERIDEAGLRVIIRKITTVDDPMQRRW